MEPVVCTVYSLLTFTFALKNLSTKTPMKTIPTRTNKTMAIGLICALAAISQAEAQNWLINFNNAIGYRGASQTNADANGNLWNNLNPGYWQDIVTVAGSTNGTFRGNLSGTTAGIDSYNGPLGTNVSNPLTDAEIASVIIDSTALGLLGGSKAAAAGYAVSTDWNFALYNLNSVLTYDAAFYGSHMYASATSVYAAYSDFSYTTQLASTALNVGVGSAYNSNTVATLTGLAPGASNGLNFKLSGTGGASGYLNAMSLYGYLGYLGGGTNDLNTNAPYVANGTNSDGGPRSVDTVVGNGTTLNVGSPSGIYYNSTLVMTNGGGTINRNTNFTVYSLAGAGDLSLGGTEKMTISKGGNYSGTLTMTDGTLTLSANGALGTGALNLKGGSLVVNTAQGLGTGTITVASGVTTLNNANALTALTGNNAFVLGGGGTFQVWGNGQVLDLGTGNVSVTGFNNLNAFGGGMQFRGNISGSGTLNWYGAGSLVLGGSNSFAGTLAMSGNGGSVVLSNANALQSAILNKGTNQTLVFALPGANTYNLGGLSGPGDIALTNANSLNVNVTALSSYSGALSGSGGLTKYGPGTLTLSGSNSYSGTTAVLSGVVRVENSSFTAEVGTTDLNLSGLFSTPTAGSTYQIFSGPFSGSRNVVFTPPLDSGLQASFAASNSTVTVQSVGGYSSWASYWTTNAGLVDTNGTADPDADGFVNNMEYAFDGNPTVGTPSLLSAAASGTNVVISFVGLIDTNAVSYTVQSATNLSTGPWTNNTAATTAITVSGDQTGVLLTNDYVRKEFSVSKGANTFYRVRALIQQ